VAVVDAHGAPLAHAAGGTKFWLSAPSTGATGEATVEATAQASVEKGRLFVGVDNKTHPTQTLIVAASTSTTAKAKASAKWVAGPRSPPTTPETTTTRPSPATPSTPPFNAFMVPPTTVPPQAGSLPNTGASVLPALGVALLLLGTGIGALLLQRHRRRTN